MNPKNRNENCDAGENDPAAEDMLFLLKNADVRPRF